MKETVMIPETPTLLIVAGLILVLVGIIGGGLKVKEISIPAMGTFARTAGLVVGLVLLVLGIGLEPDGNAHPAEEDSYYAPEDTSYMDEDGPGDYEDDYGQDEDGGY